MAVWFEANIGKKIILFDLAGRRFEGKIEKVFQDFVQIFELHQGLSRMFRFSNLSDFYLKGDM